MAQNDGEGPYQHEQPPMELEMIREVGSTRVLLVLGTAAAMATGCGGPPSQIVRLATTTSTVDTGLLDVLTREFENDTGIRVDVISAGTGQALAHGRNGDVDAVLVHAPDAEELFVAEGYGLERIPLMWNDFVLLGPLEDPAGVRNAQDVRDALRRVMEAHDSFVSRGDDSGTHKKERQLWDSAGLEPGGSWYVEAGQGMGACLTMANEMQAYLLSDRGTYLSRADGLHLVILLEGEPDLVNPYAIIAVNPERFPDANAAGAQRLIQWLLSPRGQGLIGDYRVGGDQLFHLFQGNPES